MSFYIEQYGKLPFETCGLSFNAGLPYATILAGKDEELRKVIFNPSTATKREFHDWCYTGEVSETVFAATQGDFCLTWRIGRLAGRQGIRIGGSFENRSGAPVRLQNFSLLNGKGIWEGDGKAWWLSSLSHSTRLGSLGDRLPSLNEGAIAYWQSINLPIPEDAVIDDEKHNDHRYRSFGDFCTLYRNEGEQGVVFGPVGKPEAFINYEFLVDETDFTFDVLSGMTEICIEPGQSRAVQELAILFGSSREIETLIRWNAETLGARNRRPPQVGWCSWYYYHKKISQKTVMATITGFEALKERLPVDVIQIDDGFQRCNGDWGWNDRFPDGSAPLVEGIRKTGAMPGIWLAPLAVQDSTGLHIEYPDWFQKDKHGAIVGEIFYRGDRTRWLDPTHPEAREFIRNIIRQKKAEGFTYYKFDFNTIGSNSRYADTTKTSLEVYRDFYALLREEIGEEGYILSCSGMTRGTVGYADASRTGTDCGHVWMAAHPFNFYEAIRGIGMNDVVNGILYYNDPDVAYLSSIDDPKASAIEERHFTEGQRRIWHTFVGLLGGLQMTSEPIEEDPYASNIRELEILSPPAPEKGHSFCNTTDREHTRFGFSAKRPWGNFASLILWNKEEAVASLSLPQKEFGPGGSLGLLGDRFHVWSFWDGVYKGIAGPDYTTGNLGGYTSLLLRLTPCGSDTGRPLLIGSTLHISMGAAEIADIVTPQGGMVIRLNAGAGARDGTLYVYSKAPLVCEKVSGLEVSGIRESAAGVYEIAVRNRDRKAACQEIELRLK
jgi:hypothetical protein